MFFKNSLAKDEMPVSLMGSYNTNAALLGVSTCCENPSTCVHLQSLETGSCAHGLISIARSY